MYQLLQVTCTTSERAINWKFIWYTMIIIALKLYRKNITSLLPLAMLVVQHTCNNTDGNKLMVYSLYYGDTYTYKINCMQLQGFPMTPIHSRELDVR